MQSSREVIDSLMRKKPAERVGLHDSPWSDTLRKWVTQGMPADDEGKAVDTVDHFGFDMANCGAGLEWQAKRGVSELVEETAEWKIVRNGNGAVFKWWKDKSGTPEHIDFAMTSREVWEKEYRPHLMDLDRERINVEAAAENLAKRRKKGYWTFFGSQFIWENMRGALGDYNLYISLVTDPGWIHDFCRVYTDMWKTYYGIYFEEAGIPDGMWVYEDLGYKERLFCSPRVLEELIFPYYKELVDFYHSFGLTVVLHTCGYTAPALDLVVAAGFDALNPMEAKAGNDALKFAEEYGDRLTLIGGLDARVLETGDRGLIKRKVVELVEGMKTRGASYVYASDHSISTNVDYEDFKYAIGVYRDHMMY